LAVFDTVKTLFPGSFYLMESISSWDNLPSGASWYDSWTAQLKRCALKEYT
jgi:hypothetical protein